MAFEGTLKDFSLADIFQLISYQKKSGALTLKGEGKKATITFETGNIISAESSEDRLDDRLGYRLVKGGLITKEQLQIALNIQKDTMQQLGYILVSQKFINRDEMQKILHDLICQKIYKFFRWKDCEYHFAVKESKSYLVEDYFTPISTQSILMEAVRMMDEWPLIEKMIPSFEVVFDKIKDESIKIALEEVTEEGSILESLLEEKKVPIKEERIESKTIKLSPEEYKVFENVNGLRSVKDIIEFSNMSDFEVARALYDLLERNIIYRKEEKRPLEIAKEEKRLPHALNLAFYFILIILIALSIFNLASHKDQIFRPAKFINLLPINPDESTINYLRINKIAQAIDLYYLNHSTYPSNLKTLVIEALLSPEEIIDPQGKQYDYQLLEDRFIISPSGTDIAIAPELSLQRFIIKE